MSSQLHPPPNHPYSSPPPDHLTRPILAPLFRQLFHDTSPSSYSSISNAALHLDPFTTTFSRNTTQVNLKRSLTHSLTQPPTYYGYGTSRISTCELHQPIFDETSLLNHHHRACVREIMHNALGRELGQTGQGIMESALKKSWKSRKLN